MSNEKVWGGTAKKGWGVQVRDARYSRALHGHRDRQMGPGPPTSHYSSACPSRVPPYEDPNDHDKAARTA